MKYPISPEYIKKAPDKLAKLWIDLEEFILLDICSRLRAADDMTATALEQIRRLKRRGYSVERIKKYIQKTLKLSNDETKRLFNNAMLDNQYFYLDVFKGNAANVLAANIVFDSVRLEADAIARQTKGLFENLTQSMGFSVVSNGVRTFLPVAKAYQHALDKAEMKVWTGAQSYNEAIRESVAELAQSGIHSVTYDNEGRKHVDKADVAVRRAVMTGISQLSAKYSDSIADAIPTDYYEVTAHRGARDVDKPNPWSNHKKWQGKVYSVNSGDKYPSIYSVCGLGEVDGLNGINCRHMYYPFWDGISERTYTDEQLAAIDPEPITYKGQQYTAYQAMQKMRSIERATRKVKRQLLSYKASGDTEAYNNAALRYRALKEEYDDFSKASGERKQDDRRNIAEFGYQDGKEAIEWIKERESAIQSIVDKINNGEISKAINQEKQARHMQGTAIEGRSVVTITIEELQSIVNTTAGTGVLRFKRGGHEWKNQELVDFGRDIGYTINIEGVKVRTTRAKIHYSKSGVHVVPFSGG